MVRYIAVSVVSTLLISALVMHGVSLAGETDPDDVVLDVPHVADTGNAWTAACITMMLKYFNGGITLENILHKAGRPPVINFGAVDEWSKRDYKLRLRFVERVTMNDIIESINKKYPVMTLQRYSMDNAGCTSRLVVGYNLKTKELIARDPGQDKPYRMAQSVFQKLWDGRPRACPGWPDRFYFIAHPADIFPGDVTLDVPFESNRGGTCASSSMAMMLRFAGAKTGFNEVLKVAGLPPVINYGGVDKWIRKEFGLKLVRFEKRAIDDIIACVQKGHPVMVLQQHSVYNPGGHNRVVVGYNLGSRELIINDPSELGYEYRMPFGMFEKMWDLLPKTCPGWPPRPMWLILPENKSAPL